MKKKFITVIIPAAGSGSRMKSAIPKQYLEINKKTILEHTVTLFQNHELITEIVLVSPKPDLENLKKLKKHYSKLKHIVAGGTERQDSVRNGLDAVDNRAEIIMVHDAARPLLSKGQINKLVKKLDSVNVAVLAVPVKNTIKVVDKKYKVDHTPDRQKLWSIQTPQAMIAKTMKDLYSKLNDSGFIGTDEAMVAEHFGEDVYIVEGDYKNIKITSPEDLALAELIMKGNYAK